MLTITITFFITLILGIIISIFIGVEKTISALPVIFTFSLVVSLFGVIFIQFFPIILICILIYYIKNRNKIKKTRFYYRRYTEKDFEDLFRNQTYSEYGKGNYQYKNNSFQNARDNIGKNRYYEILGVTSNATTDEIKKAYRELAKKHHPDRYINQSQEIRDFHEKRFKEINEAYERLTQ